MSDHPERPHRSASQLTLHQQCAAKYQFRYLDRIPLAKPIAAVRGTSVHVTAAMDYRHRMETGRLLHTDAISQFAADTVDAEFAGGVHMTEEDRKVGMAFLRGRTKDVAVGLARRHHLEVAPFRNPAMVEERIRVRPDPAILPVDIVAVLDLATKDGIVADLKT